MNQDEQQDLHNLPFSPARSRLEPHRELILRWRRQGRPYRTILKLVKEHCGVQVSYGTLHEFIQRRSRPRKAKPELEPNVATTFTPFPTPKAEAPLSRSTPSTDPYAEARERMRRLKEQPPPRKPEKRFHYTEQDSIDPLVLIPQTTKEK